MLKHMKFSLSALAVSALFLAPAATVTVFSADAAYANNGKGNGGGNGRGNSGENRGAGKSADSGAKGARGNGNKGGHKAKSGNGFASFKGFGKKSNGKSAGLGNIGKELKSFGGNLKKDVGNLFGSKSQKNRTASSYAGKEKGTLHPSNLGKLNGAINSSPRAKEAHIANGQYANGTGPVSLAAALAVADYEYTKALEGFDMAKETVALADAFDTLDAATPDELTAAEDIMSTYDEDMDGVLSETERATAIADTADSDMMLDDASLDRAQELSDAASLTDGEERPENVDEARDIVENEEIAREAVEEAEDNLLAEYKGELSPPPDDSDMRLSEQEQKVVDTVRASNPDEETVGGIIGPHEVEEDGEEVTEDEGDGTVEDETASAMTAESENTEG